MELRAKLKPKWALNPFYAVRMSLTDGECVGSRVRCDLRARQVMAQLESVNIGLSPIWYRSQCANQEFGSLTWGL